MVEVLKDNDDDFLDAVMDFVRKYPTVSVYDPVIIHGNSITVKLYHGATIKVSIEVVAE